MFDRKLINVSVKWLIIPIFLWNDRPPWADNIVCPSTSWGVGGTYKIWDLEIQPGGRYRGVDFPCNGASPAHTDYLRQSLENFTPCL